MTSRDINRTFIALAAILIFALPILAFGAGQNVITFNKQYLFSGSWMPDEDPTLIGPTNFSRLRNLRYTDTSIEATLGYSKVNSYALPKNLIKNGHQLYCNETDIYSYVLVQAKNSAGSSSVYINSSSIPSQGNFTTAAIHDDAAGSGVGRFSDGPSGTIVYSNGRENYIWGGNETRVSGFYTVSDGNGTSPKDLTDAVRNDLDDEGNYASIGDQRFWIVLSTRTIKAVKYTIKTANTTNGTTTAKYWNGTDFQAVSNFNDGTESDGKTLAQDGWMTFNSTSTTAKPHHFEGTYLYAYLF